MHQDWLKGPRVGSEGPLDESKGPCMGRKGLGGRVKGVPSRAGEKGLYGSKGPIGGLKGP